MNSDNPRTYVGLIIAAAFILLIVLPTIWGSWTVVDAGERAVVLKFGQVNRILDPGFHLKMPWVESVKKMEVRTQKIENEASAASKDLQTVTTNVALQYHLQPDSVGTIYAELRNEYRARVIDPAIQDAVKAATAKFTAEELITRREDVKAAVRSMLEERLLKNYIVVDNVDIINFNFSAEFNAAIERKVTAEQNALTEKNNLAAEGFKADQQIEKARGEAETTRLQAQALASQSGNDFLRLKELEVQLETAKKWNGVLPVNMYAGAPIPLINLNASQ